MYPTKGEGKKSNRAKNRRLGEQELAKRGIPYLSKNYGAHLIVYPDDPQKRVDFWPGPVKWRNYWGSKEGIGMETLLEFLESA